MLEAPKSLQDYALTYASRGWYIFPLVPGTKIPMRGSNGCKDATTNRDQIIAWWTNHPDANIGIATGEASNLAVIDVDAKPGKHGAATLEALEEEFGRLPETATVLTSGHGRHYYFAHAFLRSTGVGALGLNIDVQSDGRYVVAPPSIHPDGTVYEWADEVTLAELPGWVVTFGRPEMVREDNIGEDRTRRSTTPCKVSPYTGVTPSLFRGLEADRACAHALGLPLTGRFSCILPGHRPDTNPSASLFVGRGGDLLYLCFHRGDLTLTLPQVRASLANGQRTLFKDGNGKGQKGEHVVWRLRLLYEAGVLKPVDIPHRPLPEDVRPATAKVFQGAELLLGLKEHLWPGDPPSYSWRFAQAWCGKNLTRMRSVVP